MRRNNLSQELEISDFIGQYELKDLLSSIDEVIFIADAYNLDLLYANDACYKIYGYAPEEMKTDKNIFLNSLHPDDKENFYSSYLEVHQKGIAIHEFRVINKDGTVRTLRAKTELKKGNDLYPDVIRGITIDITELKDAEQKLIKQLEHIKLQNQKLQEISWIQSHKVRGPVANILGLAKLFNLQDPADTQNIEVLQAFKATAEELDNIIAEINDVAGLANMYSY